MMKRILACLLAIACLLTAVSALADGDMRVIKVKKAVNMRQKPNTDCDVVAQVPLGTVLSGCQKEEGTEWYACTYQGISGYIRYDFLEAVTPEGEPAAEPAAEPAPEPAAEPAPEPAAEPEPIPAEPAAEPAPAVELAPAAAAPADGQAYATLGEGVNRPIESITAPSAYADDAIILDTTLNGVRVVARQIFTEEYEYIMVVGVSAEGNLIWAQETKTGSVTELMQTDCFVGGTAENPLVMLYNTWTGLMALDPATGMTKWAVLKEQVELGASITYAVDANGVAYVGGYYGPDPVAIDAEGNVLWQTSSSSAHAQWLYGIEPREDGLYAHYSMLNGDKSGWVVYNYDGTARGMIYN